MPYNQLFNTKYYYHPTYIGYGVTSYVYKGYFNEGEEQIFIAIKQIAMEKISMRVANYITNEIQILSELNHPQIVKMYDHFVHVDENNQSFTYIIFEWLSKNELELLIKKDYLRWKDDDILYLFRELINGVKYLHDNDIIHRDIKPTNIVLIPNNKSKYKNIGLKLIDFGFSVKSENNDLQNTVCGSPMYMAPEMPLGKSYDKKIDIWSLGIVLHQMKYGIVPFHYCKTMYDLLRVWEKNEYNFNNVSINNIAIDHNNVVHILITKLLNQNIEQRFDADAVIKYIDSYFDSKVIYYSIPFSPSVTNTNIEIITKPQFTQLFLEHNHSRFNFDLEHENFINTSLTNSTIPRVGSLEDYFIILNEKPDADETFDMMDDYFELVTFTSNDSIFNRIPLIDNFSIDKCVAYINDAKNIITNKLRQLGYV